MILTDSIRIQARPDEIFRVFEDMERHYREWYRDHVPFRWIAGRGVRKGHVFHVVPNRHIEFAPTFWLMKLFLLRMVFRIEPEADDCRFTAEIHLRMGPPCPPSSTPPTRRNPRPHAS